MMGYGYDPQLSRTLVETAGVSDLNFCFPFLGLEPRLAQRLVQGRHTRLRVPVAGDNDLLKNEFGADGWALRPRYLRASGWRC
jgi:hypothetical protein